MKFGLRPEAVQRFSGAPADLVILTQVASTTRAAAARRFIKLLTGETSRALRMQAGFDLAMV